MTTRVLVLSGLLATSPATPLPCTVLSESANRFGPTTLMLET